MELGLRIDPLLAHRFVVEIDGLLVAGFSEVTGLGLELETVDYREGGVNDFVHRLPGPARAPGNLTLRRGVTMIDFLWRWQEDAAKGRIRRRNGAIILLGQNFDFVAWSFLDGYPARWTGPDLRAGDSVVALESLEIAHRGIKRRGLIG